MRRFLALCLALLASATVLFVPASAAEAGETADAYGTAAPAVEGVKWWLAPTYWGLIQPSGPDGRAIFKNSGGWGALNQFGKKILPNQFAHVEIHNNYAAASRTLSTQDSNTGLYTLDGTQVTEHIYQQDVPEEEYAGEGVSLAKVFLAGFNGERYVNLQTKQLLPEMKWLGSFENGRVGFAAKDGRVGYMDTQGNLNYAPADYTSVWTGGETTLLYMRESGGKEYEGLCSLDFKPIVEVRSDRESFTVKQAGLIYVYSNEYNVGGRVYDLSGTLLLELKTGEFNGDPYRNEAGHLCIPFFTECKPYPTDTVHKGLMKFDSGKTMAYDTVTKETGWDAHGNLPEGYSVEGESHGDFHIAIGSVGLRDAAGKFVIPQKYAGLIPVVCGGKHRIIAMIDGGDDVLLDLNGKRLAGPYEQILVPMDESDLDLPEIPILNGDFLLARSHARDRDGYDQEKKCVLDSDGKVLANNVDTVFMTAKGFITQNYDMSWETFTADYFDARGKKIRSAVACAPEDILSSLDAWFDEDVQPVADVSGEKKLYGLCDRDFNMIVPPVFDTLYASAGGQIWVQYHDQWGIIDNPMNDTAERAWSARTAAESK